MMKQKLTIFFISLILTLNFTLGFSNNKISIKEKKGDDKVYGTILSFNSEKCNGCWGWIIKIGKDTIKTNDLPFITTKLTELKYPQAVHVVVGEMILKQSPFDYDYYKIEFLELISNKKCSNLVWYRFIGGKPDMRFIRQSEEIAKEWGFKIQYEYGSCGYTNADKLKNKECIEKSKGTLDCLKIIYGKNWQKEFFDEVDNRK